MHHKEIPFLRICVPLCAGIVTALYFNLRSDFLLIIIPFLLLLLLCSVFRRNKYTSDIFFGLFATTCFFISGYVLYNYEKKSLSDLPVKESVFSCVLDDYPENKPAYQLLTVRLKSIETENGAVSLKGSMLLYLRKDSTANPVMKPGDNLSVKCTPVRIDNRGNPYEFDYRFYMENNGIKYYSFINMELISGVKEPPRRTIRHYSLIIRNRIIELFRKSGVPEERIPLVSAITLGEKSMLDQEAKQTFVKAGIMHIMAVSGLHAVILSMFIYNLMFFMKGRLEIPRVAITLLFLWVFAFITGLTVSVLRATLMYSFIQGGKLMHRKPDGINSLLASAFILIILKPSVIFDAGFLLSYSAVLFILAFYNALYRKLEFSNRIADLIWQSAAVTIVAQLGTLPLTIMMFNRFPVYFILTNVIIVPVSSLVIIAGLIVPCLYPLSFLNPFPGLILGHLTGLTEYLTEKAAALPLSTIENIGMTLPQCMILFVLILVLTDFLPDRKKSILLPGSLILLFAIVTLFTNKQILSRNELIVYNTRLGISAGIRTGTIMDVYTTDTITDQSIIRHCAVLNLSMRKHNQIKSYAVINTGKKKILLYKTGKLPDNIDPDIIITDSFRSVSHILIKHPEKIVFTTASGPAPDNYGLDDSIIHLTRKSGACITPI